MESKVIKDVDRRLLLAMTAGGLLASCSKSAKGNSAEINEKLGLINQIKTTPGDRSRLIEIMRPATQNMPGCISYALANDFTDPDLIWITEVGESEVAHAASLELQMVQDAISQGRKYIAGMTQIAKTRPI